jgi:hypothetical protein
MLGRLVTSIASCSVVTLEYQFSSIIVDLCLVAICPHCHRVYAQAILAPATFSASRAATSENHNFA